MQELIDILLHFSGWLFVLILYTFLGVIMGTRLAKLWGYNDDLRWISIGIGIAWFAAFPATYYLFYASQNTPMH